MLLFACFCLFSIFFDRRLRLAAFFSLCTSSCGSHKHAFGVCETARAFIFGQLFFQTPFCFSLLRNERVLASLFSLRCLFPASFSLRCFCCLERRAFSVALLFVVGVVAHFCCWEQSISFVVVFVVARRAFFSFVAGMELRFCFVFWNAVAF